MENLLHERWSQYTEEEINKIKRERCIDCPYNSHHFNGHDYVSESVWTCNYFIDTGIRRPTRPELCELNPNRKI